MGRYLKPCCRLKFGSMAFLHDGEPLHILSTLFPFGCPECDAPRSSSSSSSTSRRRRSKRKRKRRTNTSTNNDEKKKQQQQEEEEEEERRRKIASSSSSSSSSVVVLSSSSSSQRTLADVPPDIAICAIASRLSLWDLLRARCVCKLWRDSIFSSSPAFLSPDCRRPRLVVQHSSPQGACLATFDPCLNRWFLIPTPASFLLQAAAGGHFCFSTDGHQRRSLVVGNPLLKQWRHLPPLPHPSDPLFSTTLVISMIADPAEPGSYKVIVLADVLMEVNGATSPGFQPYRYDSKTGFWETRPQLPGDTPPDFQHSLVKLPHTLYCFDTHAWAMLTYDLAKETLAVKLSARVPFLVDPDEIGRLPMVVHCDGRLFLVARLEEQLRRDWSMGRFPVLLHRPLGIWVRDPPDNDPWELVSETPRDLLKEVILDSEGTDFVVASNGSDCIWLILKGSSKMLAFYVLSRTWAALLPGCPADFQFTPGVKKAFYQPLLPG